MLLGRKPGRKKERDVNGMSDTPFFIIPRIENLESSFGVHRSLLTLAPAMMLVAGRCEIVAVAVMRGRRPIESFESFVSLPPVIRRKGCRPAVKNRDRRGD
jgi:hypothetical protein